jgi:putative endonuclease
MAFFVYIIYSESRDKFYIGASGQPDDRIFRHNNSGSKYTKTAKDWVVKYVESFDTFAEALARERVIKKKKSRKYIEYLISSQNQPE